MNVSLVYETAESRTSLRHVDICLLQTLVVNDLTSRVQAPPNNSIPAKYSLDITV